MLEVDVTVKYDNAKRLKVEIEAGITLVLGEVGSYKSTLLKVIGGVTLIEDGKVVLDGHNIEEIPPRERDMMLVSSETMPICRRVDKALIQPLRLRGANRREARVRASEAAKKFGLDMNGRVDGQTRALFEARMSLRNTSVTMFDEPYHFFGEDVSDMIRGRKSEYVIVTSSDGEDARRLRPDRLIVMRNGTVLQSGKYDEVRLSPADKYVDLLVNM